MAGKRLYMGMRGRTAKVDLVQVLRRLNPNVPAGGNEDVLPRTPRDSNAARQIRAHVGADPHVKLLLTGHIGVGKSTELLNLAKESQEYRWVVFCSVAETLGVHNVTVFSLLVMLLRETVRSWTERLGDVPPGLVEALVERYSDAMKKESYRFKSPYTAAVPDVMVGAGRKLRLSTFQSGADLLRLYDAVLRGLALRSVTRDETMGLDPGPMAGMCELVLKELADRAGRPVLLIIDDLDKLRDQEARDDIFLNRAMTWRWLPCGIVATLPLDAVFSPIGPDLDQVWVEGPLVLDPLPVPEAEGGALDDEALQPYLKMLRSVNAEGVFSGYQCRRLANASSGLPRTFVAACATCVRYALEAGEEHIRDYHVDLVMRDLTERWQGRLNDSDYEALVGVLDSGGSNVPKAITLLRDGILVRDGAAPPEKRYRLATWAEPLLGAYRLRRQRAGTAST